MLTVGLEASKNKLRGRNMEKICIKFNDDYLRLGNYVHLKNEPSNVYYKVTRIQCVPGIDTVVTIMDYRGQFYTATVDAIDGINEEVE